MYRKINIVFSLLIFLCSCGEVSKRETGTQKINPQDSATALKRPRYNSIAEVVAPKGIARYWASKESYYPTVHFDERDTLWIEFDGQCEYRFPYKQKGKNIIVEWDFIEDCTHDIGIKKSYGLKDQPFKGKPFMLLQLADDTTLRATYLFKDWINAVNNGYKGYQLFPEVFLSCGE